MKLADLKEHAGDSVIVEGTVRATQYGRSGNPSSTFLTIGSSANSLTVVITKVVRNKFTVRPEDAYRDKSIRVSGRLVNNNGQMQIVINDPSQIVLVDHK